MSCILGHRGVLYPRGVTPGSRCYCLPGWHQLNFPLLLSPRVVSPQLPTVLYPRIVYPQCSDPPNGITSVLIILDPIRDIIPSPCCSAPPLSPLSRPPGWHHPGSHHPTSQVDTTLSPCCPIPPDGISPAPHCPLPQGDTTTVPTVPHLRVASPGSSMSHPHKWHHRSSCHHTPQGGTISTPKCPISQGDIT